MESHLSSEQLERALAGQAEPQVMEHVAGCAACQAEVACFGAMFGEMKVSAMEVAAVQRRRAVAVEARPARRGGVWATAVTATVFVAAAVPFAVHRPAVKQPVAVTASGSAATTAGANAAVASVSDAELMSSIQSDLASNVPEPMQALEGTEANSTAKAGNN